jgi:hypothetical protein
LSNLVLALSMAKQFEPRPQGKAERCSFATAANIYPQRWSLSPRVKSSGSDADDATLVQKIEVA